MGIPPSYREIQKHFGYKAIGTVQDHVRCLMEKGRLEQPTSRRAERKARGLIPKGLRSDGVRRLPIYGEIAAGSARESEQVELGTLTISKKVVNDPCFGLRVVGNSMVDAGILEGDILIVERGHVKSGEIVVALLDGETTVKRYVRKDGRIFLVPENRLMKPIEMTSARFEIQGKVVALFRRFGSGQPSLVV